MKATNNTIKTELSVVPYLPYVSSANDRLLKLRAMFPPIMENGFSAQYYQQQNHHRLQPLSMSSQPPPPVTWEQQYPSRLYPTSFSHPSSSMKRGRVSSEESSGSISSLTCDTATQPPVRISNCDEPSPQVPVSTTPKKARSSNYRAPQSVKPSLLTAMGTLAGGTTSKNMIHGSVTASVPIRRRLSGGHLEQYIGGNEKAVDNDSNRPRSMSF